MGSRLPAQGQAPGREEGPRRGSAQCTGWQGSATRRVGRFSQPRGPSWPPGTLLGLMAPLPPLIVCPPPTDASDLQGRQLLASLDKVASDLDRQEKAVTGILRPPLEQGRAVQDSAERAEDLKVPLSWGSGCTHAQGLTPWGLGTSVAGAPLGQPVTQSGPESQGAGLLP